MMEELDDQKSTQGVEEYWAIVVRRKWWILGSALFRMAAGLCVSLGYSRQVCLGKRGAGRASEGS